MSELAGARPHSGTLREAIDPADLGSALLSPAGEHEAGSYATLTLTYTAGCYGIDDSGALRICFRFASDQSRPQLDDPAAPGYTVVEASNGATLECRFDPKGNVRPWDRTLYIKVVRGFLREGETITVRFGVTDGGSPGLRLQTFCEERFEFRVLVDPIATYNFQPLPVQPAIRIVPGPPARFLVVAPTLRGVGEPFALGIKGEDRWGNPSDRCDATFRLSADGVPVEGLPERVRLAPGERAVRIEGLRAAEPGELRFALRDEEGRTVAASNPLRVVEAPALRHWWVDLHGQSGETIGTNRARDYFAFARDLAFLDAVGHQGNDFQITAALWRELDSLCARFDEPGRFVTVPGYEWSGNTGLGGDRNVYFPAEGRRIRRSSHALIDERDDLDSDCRTAAELFAALARDGEWDVVVFAHCGGRYADLRCAHDGRFERSVEIHSSWGTFEWLLHDALALGHRVGVVANSDGHKGRPGASYPGASLFGAIGGLTCLLAPELSRAALLECLRRRRHYATTGGPGGRLLLDVRARLGEEGTRYHDDPALGEAAGTRAREALMGDIVHLPRGAVQLSVEAVGAAPIERLDLFNGLEHLETVRPYGEPELGSRIRVLWEGAEYRGRFRQVIWDGRARVAGNRLREVRPVNFFNPDRRLERDGENGLRWRALTTGNLGGFDLWLEEPASGTLEIETALVRCRLAVAEIGYRDTVFERSAELPRRLRVFRLPDRNRHHRLRLERAVSLRERGDNPLYVRLTQEDGTLAWSSPIYVYRRA